MIIEDNTQCNMGRLKHPDMSKAGLAVTVDDMPIQSAVLTQTSHGRHSELSERSHGAQLFRLRQIDIPLRRLPRHTAHNRLGILPRLRRHHHRLVLRHNVDHQAVDLVVHCGRPTLCCAEDAAVLVAFGFSVGDVGTDVRLGEEEPTITDVAAGVEEAESRLLVAKAIWGQISAYTSSGRTLALCKETPFERYSQSLHFQCGTSTPFALGIIRILRPSRIFFRICQAPLQKP